MRVAALYDIHGNLPALEAVLEEVASEDVELLVIGGDVVSGPMPMAVLELLQSSATPTRFIQGNADREVVDYRGGLPLSPSLPEFVRELTGWVAAELEPKYRELLAGWPETLELELEIGKVLFCHASPRNNIDVFTRLTPEEKIRTLFADSSTPTVVCGHTHMQYERSIAGKRILNAGSVGMPYGEPGAYWLLLGSEVQFRYTPFDLDQAAQRVMATSYPQASEFAKGILKPPTQAEALEVFEVMAAQLEL